MAGKYAKEVLFLIHHGIDNKLQADLLRDPLHLTAALVVRISAGLHDILRKGRNDMRSLRRPFAADSRLDDFRAPSPARRNVGDNIPDSQDEIRFQRYLIDINRNAAGRISKVCKSVQLCVTGIGEPVISENFFADMRQLLLFSHGAVGSRRDTDGHILSFYAGAGYSTQYMLQHLLFRRRTGDVINQNQDLHAGVKQFFQSCRPDGMIQGFFNQGIWIFRDYRLYRKSDIFSSSSNESVSLPKGMVYFI